MRERGTGTTLELSTLVEIERKVLWLATSLVHHANRVRPSRSGLKVGGHQASSASMVTIMTELWIEQLKSGDRVAVKPHASPVLHALEYVLGLLGEEWMTTLREFGGLQSYPSRRKDPIPADYSTGSVGIGATAPIWAAIARRFTETLTGERNRGRQYSLVGDAELDEGAIWEAVLDPTVQDLGEIVWIIDFNRQSLDRVVPIVASDRLQRLFEAAGWQVIPVKFGEQLEQVFASPNGPLLRDRIVAMSNAEYQRLLRCSPDELRVRLPGTEVGSEEIAALIGTFDDRTLAETVRNLGGHDFRALRAAFDAIDDSRPTAIIAYTLKGYGLPSEGHPQNHSALLSAEQYEALSRDLGERTEAPWSRFDEGSRAGQACRAARRRLNRGEILQHSLPMIPVDLGRTPSKVATTQAAVGRTLVDLARAHPELARRIVTVSPDVSSSTNLAGWINRVGIWSANEKPDWFSDDSDTLLHWKEHPSGQHFELGIAEVNLVSLLGELGSTWSRWGEPLIPIGTIYDPFVERALEPWSYGIYAGGQSILIGTPSGVTLAPEGGAHQSIKTPSIGLEQPECTAYEPAFVSDLEWTLLEAMRHIGKAGGRSAYFRLSTRPIDQSLAQVPEDGAARERRRLQSVAGGYVLRACEDPEVTLVAVGAITPEVLAASDKLDGMRVRNEVLVVTSPGLLFEALQSRQGVGELVETWILDQLFPTNRSCPMVTVLDGHPHTLAFLASIRSVPSRNLGVSSFGQSGDIDALYRHHGIDASSIVRAALDLVQ